MVFRQLWSHRYSSVFMLCRCGMSANEAQSFLYKNMCLKKNILILLNVYRFLKVALCGFAKRNNIEHPSLKKSHAAPICPNQDVVVFLDRGIHPLSWDIKTIDLKWLSAEIEGDNQEDTPTQYYQTLHFLLIFFAYFRVAWKKCMYFWKKCSGLPLKFKILFLSCVLGLLLRF